MIGIVQLGPSQRSDKMYMYVHCACTAHTGTMYMCLHVLGMFRRMMVHVHPKEFSSAPAHCPQRVSSDCCFPLCISCGL